MKDNKQNLNNELNDDEMESVAGGAEKDWGFFHKRKFKKFAIKLGYDDEAVQDLINHYSPKEVLQMMEEKSLVKI